MLCLHAGACLCQLAPYAPPPSYCISKLLSPLCSLPTCSSPSLLSLQRPPQLREHVTLVARLFPRCLFSELVSLLVHTALSLLSIAAETSILSASPTLLPGYVLLVLQTTAQTTTSKRDSYRQTILSLSDYPQALSFFPLHISDPPDNSISSISSYGLPHFICRPIMTSSSFYS